jgi:hypothetical protein
MKRPFCRFATSQSCARLLSILSFAALGLYYPSESFAVVYCKDNNPLTPCTRFSGSTCPPSTRPAYTTKCSTQGGSSGSGSDWQAAINIGQLGWGMVLDESGDDVVSLCDPDFFFDIEQNSVQPSFGTYTPTGGEPQAAQFFFNEWRCSCLEKGECQDGLRTSISTCPTFAPITISTYDSVNLAGCTGTVTVLALDGTPLREGTSPNCTGTDTSSDGCAIRYGDGLGGLNTESACATAFPDDDSTGLNESQMARVTQVCTETSDQKNELFVDVDVRAIGSDYQSQTQFFSVLSATCQPANANPGACPNNGGLWIAMTLAEGDQCVADNFTCGGGDGGPSPERCRVRNGQCECRCAHCGEDGGALVNLGSGNTGSYVIFSSSSRQAYECPVRIVGN